MVLWHAHVFNVIHYLEYSGFHVSPYSFLFRESVFVNGMESVGLKIARFPKQLIRTQVISSSLSKGIKPAINGIKCYGTMAGKGMTRQMQQNSPPPLSSFSTIR